MMTALVSEVAGTTLFAYVIGALVNIVLNLDPETRLRKQKVRSRETGLLCSLGLGARTAVAMHLYPRAARQEEHIF